VREEAITTAQRLLATRVGEIAELWVRPFEDDISAHDNAIQEKLSADFIDAFEDASFGLSAQFGQPFPAGEDENEAVPLCGVLRSAIWSVGGRKLWLAAAHEDRECPFLLLLGTMR
jgi:hypothetical protein